MSTITVPMGLAGRFRLEAVTLDASGSVVSRRELLPWFDNLITDGGLNLLGSTASDNLTYCRIGTGNTPPTNGDTGLVAQVGATQSSPVGVVHGLSVDGTYIYRRVTRRFPANSAAGLNLAEVGMAATSSGQIFSRTLLKDAEGNPTTISLTPEEVLDVVYELRAYLPEQDITTNVTIDGIATTVTMRHSKHATALGNWALALGKRVVNEASNPSFASYYPAAELPSATSVPVRSRLGTQSLGAYTAGSHFSTYTLTFGLNEANFAGGIGAVVMGSDQVLDPANTANPWGTWMWGFNPKLNKTDTRTASITVRVGWARQSP